MNNWMYYVYALLAIVVAFYIIRKVTQCLIRIIVVIVLLAALALGYYYLQGQVT
jgi:hypothetical protein